MNEPLTILVDRTDMAPRVSTFVGFILLLCVKCGLSEALALCCFCS